MDDQYYSLDLRRRAAAFCLKHGSGQTAETFSIGRATAVRWAAKFRVTGDIVIGKVGGYRRPVLECHQEWLRERIGSESHGEDSTRSRSRYQNTTPYDLTCRV